MSNFSPPPSPSLLLVDAGVDIAGVVDEDDALLAAAAARALDLVLLPVVAVAVRLLLPGKGVSSSIKSEADSSNESMESLLPGVRYDIFGLGLQKIFKPKNGIDMITGTVIEISLSYIIPRGFTSLPGLHESINCT